MRIRVLIVIAAVGLLGACTRKDDTSAHQVGREAYHATQDIKKGAKKAANELKKAGKEIREGWAEAKREDKTKKK